jgi:hypothetical protein
MRPRVIANEKMEIIPRSYLARTGGGLAEPNGHSVTGGGGGASAGPVSSAGKGFTIVRLADGHGVGGRQDLKRPFKFVFTAIFTHASQTRMSIIQCYQTGADHGKTPQGTSRSSA